MKDYEHRRVVYGKKDDLTRTWTMQNWKLFHSPYILYNEYILYNVYILYSERPKSEHVRISDRRLSSRSNFCSVVYNAEIRTHLFGFQTQNSCSNTKQLIVRISNRTQLSEIRTNVFGFRRYIQPNKNWNRTEGSCLKSERVRISDVHCILLSPFPGNGCVKVMKSCLTINCPCALLIYGFQKQHREKA